MISQRRPPSQGKGMSSSFMSHIAILIQPAAKYFCRGRIPAELTSRLLTCETDDFLEQTFMALFKWNEKGVLRRHAEAIQEGFCIFN